MIPFRWHSGKENHRDRKQINGCLGVGGGIDYKGDTRESFCCDGLSYILIVVVVTGLYVFVITHRIICQKGWILLPVIYTLIKVTVKT